MYFLSAISTLFSAISSVIGHDAAFEKLGMAERGSHQEKIGRVSRVFRPCTTTTRGWRRNCQGFDNDEDYAKSAFCYSEDLWLQDGLDDDAWGGA